MCIAGDVPDTVVVLVTREELCCIGEERGIRETIVLEDDRPVLMLEDSIQTEFDSGLAAAVLVAVQPGDVTPPVDLGEFVANRSGQLGVFRSIHARTVRNEVELRGPSSPDDTEQLCDEGRPIEGDNGDGRLQHRRYS